MVCSITRGPANPISAPGSAMFKSPSIAKLAVTPPVVVSLKTFRQLLANGLFNHPRTSKPNQCARLCNVQVAQHRKACGYAARCGIGEHADIRHLRIVQLRERS